MRRSSNTTPPRPRPASRPRSAGTTRTRSYFDSKEGKAPGNDDAGDVPLSPFFRSSSNFHTDADDDDNTTRPIFSLLGDLDGDGDFNNTRTVKPQDQFIDDMQFSFAGVRNVYRYLRGSSDCSTLPEILCEPGTKSASMKCEDDSSADNNPAQKDANSLKARGPIGILFVLCHYIMSSLLSYCGDIMKLHVKSEDGNEASQSEEDGLFMGSSKSKPASKPINLLRVEERIRRELALEAKLLDIQTESNEQSCTTPSTNDDSDMLATNEATLTPEKKFNAAKIDESFWMSPGSQLIGPKSRCGNVQQDVELTIQVEEIKFSQHPEITDEEKALRLVNDLYDQYRKHIDANSFQYSVTRLTGIFQRLRSVHAEGNEESKESNNSTPASMLIPLLEDLKSTSSSLIAESDFIRTTTIQIKRGWKELQSARDNNSSTSAEMNIKTDTLSNGSLNDDVKRLRKEMKSTKRALNQIHRSELYASTMTSLQFLDDVESTLSNMDHFEEAIELVQPNSSEPGWIPKEEKVRRKNITSEKYFARLLVNGIVVGDTKVGQLDWPSYSLKLSHRFNLKLSQKPTDTCIQIWKSSFGFVPDSLICTCYNVVQNNGLVDSDQSNDESNHGSPRHVMGDWLQFSSNGSDLQQRWKGTVMILSTCVVQVVKRPSPATRMANMPRQDVFKCRQMKRLIQSPLAIGDVETRNKKSAEVINSFQANDFCPDRQSMMAFKLPGSDILFSNKSLLEEPLRHILIKKRNINPASVPSPIPTTELMVQNNDKYHELINAEEFDDDMVLGGATQERALVKKQHIMDIFRGIKQYTQLKETRRRKYHSSEVIQDVGLFRFANDEEFQVPFPPKKRSLFPNAIQQLPLVRNQSRASCSLLLTIAGGKNVPKLKADTLMDKHNQLQEVTSDDSNNPHLSVTGMYSHSVVDDEEGEAYLGVLAKVRFRGKTFMSKVATGQSMSPQWNETICITLDMPQENSMTSPGLHKDELIDIFLFDCINLDLRKMGGFYDDEDTTISEFRYLGHVSIPLVTVLKGTVDGFVACHSPDIIVGYAKEPSSAGLSTGDSKENGCHLSVMDRERHQESNSTTMLRVHATTEPLRMIPPQLCPDFPSNESEFILAQVKHWSQDHLNFNGIDPEDHCSVLWPDNHGNSFLVSRFLTELEPPSCCGLDNLAGCAHYVSLLENRDVSLGIDENMVLTSQQIINLKAANREERSILLTNFFLYLSKKDPAHFGADLFLAVGFAIPEGRTAWVLRRSSKTKDVVFWDATTGRAYAQNDESCPLHKIYYLASPYNIYSNNKREKKPLLLDFDISNPRKWTSLNLDGKPAENSKMTLTTVQGEALHFTPPDAHYAREVQGEIGASIQDAIRGWRRSTTSFRSDVATKISHTIEKLEQAKLSGQPMVKTLIPDSITNTRTVFGFSLHVPFTSVHDVLTHVEATEIHHNRNPRIEYAVAVRAFPYPGGVISLWVFVCSLVPKS